MCINYIKCNFSESIWCQTLTNYKIIQSIVQIIDSSITNRGKTIQFTSMNFYKHEHFINMLILL